MEEEERRLQGPDQGAGCETVSSCNVIKSHQQHWPNDLRKDDIDRHVKTDEEKSAMSQFYKKNYKQLRTAESRKTVFGREEHTNWLPNTN